MQFQKATLQAVSSAPSANPQPVGSPIEVQLNPASLRLQLQNNVDAGKAFARPNTQYQGSSSSTLSFDLLFDTADEGDTETPVDVRTRTAQLERFLLPAKDSPKAVPPRVQFTYGTLTVVGVMTAMSQDFDFFALNGVPLRAKCAVTIKEQRPEFDAKLTGPGANTGIGATPPLPPGAGAGAGGRAGAPPPGGSAPPDRTGTALGGESASDFAARMGLDPRAWKDLAGALPDPLSLEAGLQVDFSSSVSLDVGLGVELGVTTAAVGDRAGRAAGAAGEARRAASVPARAVPDQPPADGPALTAAGGLSRALDRASRARAATAADAARAAFARPAPPRVAGPSLSRGPEAPSAPAPAVAHQPSTAAATVTADPRAVTYGFGVPLRERRQVARRSAVGLVHERSRTARPAADGVPESDDPTVPRWEALPGRRTAGSVGPGGSAGGPAGSCRGGCGPGAGPGRGGGFGGGSGGGGR